MLESILTATILLLSITAHPVAVLSLESVGYPAAARDAQIQGKVEIEIKISTSGEVVSARSLSGHPLLRQVCEENVKRWKFSSDAEQSLVVDYEFSLEEPRTSYRSDSKNYFDLPSRVRVVTNLPASMPQTINRK